MGMPVEDEAREAVANNSELNIHQGKIAAYKALAKYVMEGIPDSDRMLVPDLPSNDQRLDDISLQSFNSIRNSWIAMYAHWKYPDLFVTVQCQNGAIYTQVSKHVQRASDLSQATLW